MFVSSYVFGILSFVSLAVIVLLLIIAGSLPGYSYYDYYNYNNNYNNYCKRSILQDETTTTFFANETMPTIGSSAATGGGWWTTLAATGDDFTTAAWSGWVTEPPFARTQVWTRPETTQVYCAQVYRDPYYSYPTHYSALQTDVGAIIALIVLSVFQWIFNFVFIGVSDALILKAIGESAGGSGTVGRVVVQAGVVLVHPCASCAAPLQFQRTGPATQVQCYKCSAVCEFQTA
jgi:hypothetical protein